MIDPRTVTNFDRTPEEFLGPWKSRGYTPFGAIRTMDMDGTLTEFLRSVKMRLLISSAMTMTMFAFIP